MFHDDRPCSHYKKAGHVHFEAWPLRKSFSVKGVQCLQLLDILPAPEDLGILLLALVREAMPPTGAESVIWGLKVRVFKLPQSVFQQKMTGSKVQSETMLLAPL